MSRGGCPCQLPVEGIQRGLCQHRALIDVFGAGIDQGTGVEAPERASKQRRDPGSDACFRPFNRFGVVGETKTAERCGMTVLL